MSARPWTRPEIRGAAWRLASGETPAETAEAIGRSRLSVRRAIERSPEFSWGDLIRWGRENRRRPVIAAYLRSEISLVEAAERMGMRPTAVTNMLRREGLRPAKGTRKRVTQYPVSVERSCYVLRQDGWKQADIARHLGIPQPAVGRLTKRYERRMASWRRES